jgi:diguanylate cyclase (GGDEF)-like protein
VARYGGEEFAVLLPETGAHNAEHVGEALCKAVADLGLVHAGSSYGRVTVSIGVAGVRCDARTSAASIMTAADGALYVAKEQGRNRVCVAAESPSLTLVRPAG